MNLPTFWGTYFKLELHDILEVPKLSGLSQIGVDLHENGINFLGSKVPDNMLSWKLTLNSKQYSVLKSSLNM